MLPDDCTHGWDCPEGVSCPDCLWDKAARMSPNNKSIGCAALAMTREALKIAVSLMPDTYKQKIVIRAAKGQNIWKAIKIAREFRHDYLQKRRG